MVMLGLDWTGPDVQCLCCAYDTPVCGPCMVVIVVIVHDVEVVDR